MKKNILSVLLVLGLINISIAQDTVLRFKSKFKINPFSLIDWHNQAFTVAYERATKSNSIMPFTWQIEAGPIMANYSFPNDYYRGFKTRLELRYYTKQRNPYSNPEDRNHFFIGINTGYNRVWYKTTMSYNPTGNGSSWSGIHKLKEVSFVKQVNTVNMLLGFTNSINSKLMFELYGGLGTRRTNIKSKTPNYFMIGWLPDNQFDLSGYYTEAGKFNYMNVTGGMKFGFILN